MLAPWLLAPALALLGDITTGEARFTPTPAEATVPALYRLPAATYRYEFEPVLDARAHGGPLQRAPVFQRRLQQRVPDRGGRLTCPCRTKVAGTNRSQGQSR